MKYSTCSIKELIRVVTTGDYADMQAQDSRGRTVLHHAVMHRQVELVRMALKKGANVNVADNEDLTPLLAAASLSGADKMIPFLMKHGADVFAKDWRGQNALHFLARSSSSSPSVDLARVLIEEGISLHDRDALTSYQPLHQALVSGFPVLVNLYLDHGADVNAKTQDGEFPLYLAFRFSNEEVMKTLLKRGADVDMMTMDGLTTLHRACKDESVKSQKYIQILVSAGADVLIEDCIHYMTPFALINNCLMEAPIMMIIRVLALKKAYQPSIKLKDEKRIKLHPKLWDYYRDCIEQIEKTKLKRFNKNCTFFELLAKCPCRIAALMCNPEFEAQFSGYKDLSEFGMYAQDIPVAFQRALDRRQVILDREEMISEAADNILPYMIVRKIIQYSCKCRERVKSK